MSGTPIGQDELYEQVRVEFGRAIERLACGYVPDPERRRDLVQEIHLAVWLSLKTFNRRCSLRTWVYRVAHNTAVSRIIRRREHGSSFVNLDDLTDDPIHPNSTDAVDHTLTLAALVERIQALRPLDRQIIMLYLEELDAASIGEIVGMSAGNVATRIHRIKRALSQRLTGGRP
jgi:RNA polymerase sigma-70 factor (ECF subfamily)